MELNIHNVIQGVVSTPKSISLYKRLSKITFYVHPAANKPAVKDAVEKVWDVKVENVSILQKPAKNRVFKRMRYTKSAQKKAIVTLKKGYKIQLPNELAASEMAMQAGDNKSE